jgi:hypothetical protein
MDSKLLKQNNISIKYEYRYNRALLIFTDFTDTRLTKLADILNFECTSEIEVVEKVIRYDVISAAIIATMRVGYNKEHADQLIQTSFNTVAE